VLIAPDVTGILVLDFDPAHESTHYTILIQTFSNKKGRQILLNVAFQPAQILPKQTALYLIIAKFQKFSFQLQKIGSIGT
jgi:hypothetical protein